MLSVIQCKEAIETTLQSGVAEVKAVLWLGQTRKGVEISGEGFTSFHPCDDKDVIALRAAKDQLKLTFHFGEYNAEGLLTIADIAKEFNVPENTVKHWISTGKISPVVKGAKGIKTRFTSDVLDIIFDDLSQSLTPATLEGKKK